jgi:uncharacterized protein
MEGEIKMSEKNKETIRKANALLAEGKNDEFALICAEDVKWTLLADTPKILNGREEIRAFMTPKEGQPLELPDFTTDILIAEGDNVVCCGDMSMKGEDGKMGQYRFCDIYTFKDGKIAEFLTHVNTSEAEKGKESSATA